MVKKVWQTDGRTDGQTDRRTDRQTDWTIHRAAWSQLKTRSLLNWLVSDFDSSTCQPRLSTAQNDFSKFRPGWWQFCWMTGVKFNSIHFILVRFLHITQFTVCAAKNLTVFVADSPLCLEWSSMVAAVSRALRELSEPCSGWTREPRG